ncbi:MAG: hypothetical protein M3388_06460 [Acidobacteriota bacterium]|nr:hypothetical protein [Acidobacteriota bacterium]
MKIKVLAILGLATFIGLVGCRSAANTNTTVVTTNTGTMNSNMTMATPMSTPMAMADPATKKTIEDALAKKGITGVTVDAMSTGVTLRGTVAKGKMAEAVQVAQEAGRKPVKSELTEK